MAEKAQNLPEEKYPRSYTPKMREKILEAGKWRGSDADTKAKDRGRFVYDINPSHPESAAEYDRALSAGEKSISRQHGMTETIEGLRKALSMPGVKIMTEGEYEQWKKSPVEKPATRRPKVGKKGPSKY